MSRSAIAPMLEIHRESVASVLRRALPHDTLTERLVEILGTGAPERQAWVALNPAVTGVVYSSMRFEGDGAVGVVDLIAVHPEHQGTGIGRLLIAEVETAFRRMGCTGVIVAGHPPRYAWPGIDSRYLPALCLFQGAGYQRTGVEFTLEVPLVGNPHLDGWDLTGSCSKVRQASSDDLERILETMGEEWPQTWPAEVTAALLGQRGGVVVAEESQQLAGFCAWGGNRDNEVGPLGVRPEFRGSGLGSALIRAAMVRLRDGGFPVGFLPWAGPLAMFSRVLGAQPARTFVTLRKDL